MDAVRLPVIQTSLLSHIRTDGAVDGSLSSLLDRLTEQELRHVVQPPNYAILHDGHVLEEVVVYDTGVHAIHVHFVT